MHIIEGKADADIVEGETSGQSYRLDNHGGHLSDIRYAYYTGANHTTLTYRQIDKLSIILVGTE